MATTRSARRRAVTVLTKTVLAATATGVLTVSTACRTLEPPTAGDSATANASSPSTTRRVPVYGATSVVAMSTTSPGARVPTGTIKLETPPTAAPPSVQPRAELPPPETTTTVPPTTTTAVGTVLLRARDSRLGLILVDGVDHTLYASAADPGGLGLCTGACTEQWVPIPGYLVLADGAVNPALVGRITRADGLVQLAYAGLPLYRLNNEPLGLTMGHGDGAEWFAVSTEGSLLAG